MNKLLLFFDLYDSGVTTDFKNYCKAEIDTSSFQDFYADLNSEKNFIKFHDILTDSDLIINKKNILAVKMLNKSVVKKQLNEQLGDTKNEQL